MPRVIRGLGALTILLLTIIGVPLALAALGGNPLPDGPNWSSIREALVTPDDGTILVGLITVVGWIAWAVFMISVTSELVTLASRRRIQIHLPGLAGPQRLAAGLLISVITMATAPQLVQAQSPPATAVTVHPMAKPVLAQPEPPEPVAPVPLSGTKGEADASGHRHVVRPGDDLWSLAETYYGQGRDWRKIAVANPTVLTGGPDRLMTGTMLIIPDPAHRSASPDEPTVTVRRGDTLSALAERELGAADRWPELFDANRAQLDDPDDLVAGTRLLLPAAARGHDRKPTPVDEEAQAQVDPHQPPKPETPESPKSIEPTVTPSPVEPTPSPSTAPTALPTSPPAGAPTSELDRSLVDAIVPLTGVGALLAAGLLTGLVWRRRVQLQTRPIGRRILHPADDIRPIEVELGRRQRPKSLRTLDQAMRSISAHCRTTGAVPPPVQIALVGDDRLELIMREPSAAAPPGFDVQGRSWILSRADADALTSTPGFGGASRPWPALVTVGRDDHDRLVLADLEAIGLLQLPPAPGLDAAAILAAMAVELSFSPWADEMILTLVGSRDGLPDALGKHNVSCTDDLDALLGRIERRAAVQRAHEPRAVLGQHRIDPDLADPWAPEIVLISRPMTDDQSRRLTAVLTGYPQVTIAAVVVGSYGSAWSLRPDDGNPSLAVLDPTGLTVTPQLLDPPSYDAVLELVAATGSSETTSAPWWVDPDAPPGPPPDDVTYPGRRHRSWGSADTSGQEVIMETVRGGSGTVHHPTLQLLGPIELFGAAGSLPPRASKQCLEYCAWLLENPGTTAQAMSQALVVAEGTRRSNMSRLRTWLGTNVDGEAFLPDAYTGRIMLHPSVSSDWQRLQILTAAGVNRTSDEGLVAALELVRGAPLADAAPGQWHWAEMLRTDMISCVRDIGVELTDRALLANDLDRARWAASRALVAAPGDELLLAARIRTEHQAGNVAETERLALQLAAQARNLGVDLDPGTVTLLQRVMEGRVRARLV